MAIRRYKLFIPVFLVIVVMSIQGVPGLQADTGPAGAAGIVGKDGLSCWDLDEDKICDPDEDIDNNGACNVRDCRGFIWLTPQSSPSKNPALGDMYYHDSEAICVYMAAGWVKIAGDGSCGGKDTAAAAVRGKKILPAAVAEKESSAAAVTGKDNSADGLREKKCSGDNRFCDNGDGTVSDATTGLMWAASSNTADINRLDAEAYCEAYEGGGYTDWRMPTIDELQGLYDAGVRDHNQHELIKVDSSYVWSSDTSASSPAFFNFLIGYVGRSNQSNLKSERALPVRGGM